MNSKLHTNDPPSLDAGHPSFGAGEIGGDFRGSLTYQNKLPIPRFFPSPTCIQNRFA